MDERQWLLATAYNTGTECLQSVHIFLDSLWNWHRLLALRCWMKREDGLKRLLLFVALFLKANNVRRRCALNLYSKWSCCFGERHFTDIGVLLNPRSRKCMLSSWPATKRICRARNILDECNLPVPALLDCSPIFTLACRCLLWTLSLFWHPALCFTDDLYLHCAGSSVILFLYILDNTFPQPDLEVMCFLYSV